MRRLDEATAAALAGEITDLDAVATACCFMVYACEHVRDYDRASQWQRRVEKLSSAWRIREVFAGCRVKHAQLLLWQGRWPEAEVLLEQTMGVLERSRPEASREAAACLGELRRRQGRLAEARDLFARAEGLSIGWVGLAALALGQGDARSAIEHLDRASRRVQPDNLAVRAVILELSLDARLLLDEPVAAREAAGSLLELALLAKTPPLLSAAHVARGRIALAERRLDDAVPAFEDAVDLYAQSGAPYEAACARLLLVEALEGAGRTARGGLEADRARSALAAIGAQEPPRRPPAADAARREVQRSASAGPVPTTRELDVLRLVAEGLPDREIAARLRLSGHTVHRHVANLFTKLECSSRAAAVSKAARLGYL
jgi:ATP/maltotriose-dependent transcriptional regulator MalT